jgi:tetraacyldisaccharide 4'-kinase
VSARRSWAWPLVPLYAAVLLAKDALRGEAKTLAWPVVSVGSVSAGGAGKTPVVIALAKVLRERGWRVDVLSRGYGRKGLGIAQVDTEREDAARMFGDEPALIARATGVPVWVGSDRYAVGVVAEGDVATTGQQQIPFEDDRKKGKNDAGEKREVHLLDDGFQHRRLKRDVDIVLITAEDLDDALLPAGNRREPLEELGRADVVVIREEERGAVEARVSKLMRTGALLWSVHRRLRFPAPLGVLSAGLRPLAFCAIARPEGFASALQEAGCGIIDAVVFDDHAPYTDREVEDLLAIAKKLNASGFVTTEKDAVKLSAELRAQLEIAGPVVVVALDAEFVYPERVARELEARLV